MNRLMTGAYRFVALLLVGCFGVMAIMCCAELAFGGVAGSSGDYCDDRPALSGCLMSRLGHGAVNELVLVATVWLIVIGATFILWQKRKDLQRNIFRCRWRIQCAEILCFRDYLIELFSKGIVRSKIYGSILLVN